MGQQVSTPANSTEVPVPSQVENKNIVAEAVAKEIPKTESKCPVTGTAKTEESVSKCPVRRVNKAETKEPEPVKEVQEVKAECPVKKAPSAGSAECPVTYKNPNVYNVYNQKIDPTNQMPAQANQAPAPGQETPLPVEREQSTIPKGGTESTWLYPSPQMFWNALVRKNKTEGAREEDMLDVVRIHNNMNEATWLQILEWEKLHPVEGAGKEPKLLRFLGRPDELSPKARLKVFAGHTAPFDRHDWIVDRGGNEVRYVIDYYHDEAGAEEDKTPEHKHDFRSIKSIKLDVRPALDSPQNIVDRIVLMPFYRFMGKTEYKPLPFFPESSTVQAERKRLQMIQNSWENIRRNCSEEKQRVTDCKSEKECANAAIALQACSAHVVCPTIAKDFDTAIRAEPFDGDKADKVYGTMVKCLELFEIDSKNAFSKK